MLVGAVNLAAVCASVSVTLECGFVGLINAWQPTSSTFISGLKEPSRLRAALSLGFTLLYTQIWAAFQVVQYAQYLLIYVFMYLLTVVAPGYGLIRFFYIIR